MSTIHLISSRQGNVGKTLFASMIYFLGFAAGGDPQLVDADDQKQTLSSLHDGISRITLSDDPALESQPDKIWYLSEETKKDIIVDLAGQTDIYINDWLQKRGVLQTAKQTKTRLIKWWLSDLEPGSLAEIVRLSKAYSPNEITHVLVKSYYRARPELWDSALASTPDLEDALSSDLKVIEFPRLFGQLADDFRKRGLSFKDIVLDEKYEKVDMLNRATVLAWIEKCRSEIEQVYQFTKFSEPSSKQATKKRTSAEKTTATSKKKTAATSEKKSATAS